MILPGKSKYYVPLWGRYIKGYKIVQGSNKISIKVWDVCRQEFIEITNRDNKNNFCEQNVYIFTNLWNIPTKLEIYTDKKDKFYYKNGWNLIYILWNVDMDDLVNFWNMKKISFRKLWKNYYNWVKERVYTEKDIKSNDIYYMRKSVKWKIVWGYRVNNMHDSKLTMKKCYLLDELFNIPKKNNKSKVDNILISCGEDIWECVIRKEDTNKIIKRFTTPRNNWRLYNDKIEWVCSYNKNVRVCSKKGKNFTYKIKCWNIGKCLVVSSDYNKDKIVRVYEWKNLKFKGDYFEWYCDSYKMDGFLYYRKNNFVIQWKRCRRDARSENIKLECGDEKNVGLCYVKVGDKIYKKFKTIINYNNSLVFWKCEWNNLSKFCKVSENRVKDLNKVDKKETNWYYSNNKSIDLECSSKVGKCKLFVDWQEYGYRSWKIYGLISDNEIKRSCELRTKNGKYYEANCSKRLSSDNIKCGEKAGECILVVDWNIIKKDKVLLNFTPNYIIWDCKFGTLRKRCQVNR